MLMDFNLITVKSFFLIDLKNNEELRVERTDLNFTGSKTITLIWFPAVKLQN